MSRSCHARVLFRVSFMELLTRTVVEGGDAWYYIGGGALFVFFFSNDGVPSPKGTGMSFLFFGKNEWFFKPRS